MSKEFKSSAQPFDLTDDQKVRLLKAGHVSFRPIGGTDACRENSDTDIEVFKILRQVDGMTFDAETPPPTVYAVDGRTNAKVFDADTRTTPAEASEQSAFSGEAHGTGMEAEDCATPRVADLETPPEEDDAASDAETLILGSGDETRMEEDIEWTAGERNIFFPPLPQLLSPLEKTSLQMRETGRCPEDTNSRLPGARPVAVVTPFLADLNVRTAVEDDPTEKEEFIASAGSDLSCFRSSDTSRPGRRRRRHHSEPGNASHRNLKRRNIKLKDSWRGVVHLKPRTNKKRTEHAADNHGNPFFDGRGKLKHLWFKPNVTNHPSFASLRTNMPKFLKRRVQRKLQMEKRMENLNADTKLHQTGNPVSHPCFHCGCPGNHMPNFMRKRLRRKQRFGGATEGPSHQSDFNRENLESRVNQMREQLLRRFSENALGFVRQETSRASDAGARTENLETRIERLRTELLQKQSRAEVRRRLTTLEAEPRGAFTATFMNPRPWSCKRLLKTRKVHKIRVRHVEE